MQTKIAREPVMFGGLIVAVIEMGILMAMQMNWVNWNAEQLASFNNFVIALVALGAPIVGAYIARRKVTPLADPHTASGETAVLLPKND